ncbi:MAG: alcohol dehydrogenase catalytic domain-containing protein [Desulfovibrio sp.]|nr:alcohol dehydrogenase catalytic domain-containing protein [Desulfovibrio sp.]
MKALVYHRSIPRYLLSAFFSKIQRKRFHHLVTPLKLEDVPFVPARPGWVTIRTRLCGICGSDLNLLKGAESMLLEPYASLPMIIGHEVLGTVDAAPADSSLAKGQRVVVEPVLDCACRELPPCRFCAQGEYNLCENFLDGALPPSSVLGFNAKASGGMAEMCSAHPSKVLPVPDGLSDEDAVLVDSMASVMQPILENFPEPGSTVVVWGAGILGQHAVRCLRAMGFEGRLIVIARHSFQADMARAGGADQVLRSPGRQDLAKACGGRFIPTTMGGGNVEGGADMVFDCVASSGTFQEALLALRSRGRYVMIGTASQLNKVDVSSLWFRQLQVTGSASYATATWNGHRVRTYKVCLDLLASGGYPVQGLLTGLFRIDDWKNAFQVSFDKAGNGSMKAAFDLR